MKLFVVAALVSVAAAARLEHLERAYLPPDHSHGQPGFNSQGFASGSFGSGFESNGIDSANAGSDQYGSAFPGATSNQYLPPDHGHSGSNGQYSGSTNGFQRSQYTPQSSFGASQYNQNRFGSASNGFGQPTYQQYSNGNAGQFPSASRQYLAPKASSPQQPFDEKTGYIY